MLNNYRSSDIIFHEIVNKNYVKADIYPTTVNKHNTEYSARSRLDVDPWIIITLNDTESKAEILFNELTDEFCDYVSWIK